MQPMDQIMPDSSKVNDECLASNTDSMSCEKMIDFPSSTSTIIWRQRRRRRYRTLPLPLRHRRHHNHQASSFYRSCHEHKAQCINRFIINESRKDRGPFHQSHGRRRSNMSCTSHTHNSSSSSNNNIVTLLILLLSSTASIVAIRSSSHHHHTPPLLASSFITPTFLSSRQQQYGNHQYYYCGRRSVGNNNRASLFVSIQHPSSSSSSIGRIIGSGSGYGGIAKDVMSSFSHNHDGTNKGGGRVSDVYDDSWPLTFQSSSTAILQKLSSFSSNISRLRTARKKLSLQEGDKDETTTIAANVNKKSEDDALIRACTSLVYFLRDETGKISSFSASSFDDITWDSNSLESVKEMLEMVLIQAIRASSEVGDFVLLPKIVVAAVEYASSIAQFTTSTLAGSTATTTTVSTSIAILSPRIFGEAISSLSKTKASLSKIKSLWNYFMYDVVGWNSTATKKYPWILSSPPSSYELNAMLTSLGERGKITAAIKLYRQVVVCDGYDDDEGGRLRSMKGDAYSASILFGMLAESISSSRGRNTKSSEVDGKQEVDAVAGTSKNEKDSGVEKYVSPCWQWNEAMALLGTFAPSQLNNFAYTALLTVNERATEEYSNNGVDAMSRRRHDGVRCALLVLEKMKADKISPDVVTCSTLMTTFDKGRNWKAAVTLLNAMQQSSSTSATAASIDNKTRGWSLPPPNTYTYSSVISTCARCNQGKLALSLLNQLEENALSSKDIHIKATSAAEPNTWVYNAAISACAESANVASAAPSSVRSKISRGAYLATAFDILHKMEMNSNGNDSNGLPATALPDTVTYNTILSVLDESSFAALKESFKEEPNTEGNNDNRLSKYDHISEVVIDTLDTMEARGIGRDAITYYNAILACGTSSGSSEHVLEILRMYYSDSTFMRSNVISATFPDSGITEKPLKGRAVTGTVFVANAALSVASKTGDVQLVPEILLLMDTVNAKLNAESIKHIIRTLGKIADCEAILALLICLRGQDFANDILKARYSIDILSHVSEDSIPLIDEGVYSAAITSSLRHDELGVADQILLSMKKNGLTLNQRSLKEIISEYCRMAMISSKEEFRVARILKRQGNDNSQYGIVEPIYITSLARARAALTMLRAVEKPSPGLLSPVAKACCAAGLWQDARSILRRMHRAAIRELRLGNNGPSTIHVGEKFLDELPRLHRSLLKFCAKGGNITPALNFADDVQFLASQIRQHGKPLRGMAKTDDKEPELITISSRLLMGISTPDNTQKEDYIESSSSSTILERPFGLTGQDWKLILIAASRGGHWKVCVGTLPYLEPYVKATHPKFARESIASSSGDIGASRPSLERLNRKYDRIARALTAAVLCFEARSQYAWAMRAIDDWIEWGGRRPRKEAVASACRILAKRYRGQEVLTLMTKVLNIPGNNDFDNIDGKSEGSEYTYEKAIHTEAINALYKNGLYSEADQLYADGVTNGHLPWPVIDGTDDEQLKLDLHGMSAAVAHSAVRVSLQKEIIGSQTYDGDAKSRDVLIITGRGRRSGEMFRPVLRPEVQRMLTEEFYPPLGTRSIPGNMGALLVSSGDIEGWLNHQQKQKGERLLFVADMLRDISSGNRLERALLKKFKQEGSTPLATGDDTGE